MPEPHASADPQRQIWKKLAGPLDRSSEFSRLQMTLLVTAVATILVIRTQLWLTHYPQLGGGGLHIAHLLWGGLFMLIAIGLLLTFLGRPVRHRAALLGGVGFGFFIDELGKFITSDNNYFYQPAAALIYLIFLGLFAFSHWAAKRAGLTPREALINAIDLLGEAARHRLDERQRVQAIEFLDQADPADPFVPELRAMLANIHAVPAAAPGRLERWTLSVRTWFRRLAARPRFAMALIVGFGIWALLTLVSTIELSLSLVLHLGGAHPGFASDALADMQFQNYASVVGSFVSAVFVARGILLLRRGDRIGGLRRFQRALVVSILITQVFSFVESQFTAVFGVALNLVLLAVVRQLIANTADAEARIDSSEDCGATETPEEARTPHEDAADRVAAGVERRARSTVDQGESADPRP